MNKSLVYAIIAVVVVGGICFYGGTKYGEAKDSQVAAANMATSRGGIGGNRQNGQAGGTRTRGGGFATGSILSKTDTTITVKNPTGGSSIIIISPSTSVLKSVSGSMTDLAVGQNITAQGTSNSDGSVTAQSIQIRPGMPVSSTTPQTR